MVNCVDEKMSTFHRFNVIYIEQTHLKMKRLLYLLLLMCCALHVVGQKIDFNKGGRPESEGLEEGYSPWIVGETTSATETFDGVTITLSCDPAYEGETVMSNYWKQGVTNGAKLVGDAVIAYKNSGLSAGGHSLQAFHNNIDGFDAPPLEVYVNGVKQLTGVEQTNRQTTASASGKSFVEFNVADGESRVGHSGYTALFVELA